MRVLLPTFIFAGVSILLLFIVTLICDIFVKKHSKVVFWQHYSACLFVIYIMSVISLTLINRQINVEQGYNLIPFVNAIKHLYNSSFIELMILNIIMLVPYGFFAHFVFKKRGAAFQILSGVVFVILIEIAQLITRRGTFDIDDVILNSLGILIGFGLYKLLMAIVSKRKNKSGETL